MTDTDGRRTPARTWLVRAAACGVALAVALVVGPRPASLPVDTTGDRVLAREVRAALGARPGTAALAVAVVGPDGPRTAGMGTTADGAPVDAGTPFGIGSVGKALTGMLLADMAADGVVAPDTRVGSVATRLAGEPIGDVTLAELSQHRSGLPRFALGGPTGILRQFTWQYTGANPYAGWSPDDVVRTTAGRDLDGRGTFAYSNLGAGLLGQALAQAVGQPYPDLLSARVLAPMDMTATTVATAAPALPAGRAAGTTATGLPREHWTSAGYAPAGAGMWSTADDLARLVAGVIAGSAPGAGATRPRVDTGDGDERIGFGWFTSSIDGREIIWHNGGTGGFSSWVGVDRAAPRGVVVLSASERGVDRLGEHLLGAAPPPRAGGWQLPDRRGLVMLVVLVIAAVSAVAAARRAPPARGGTVLEQAGNLVEPVLLLVVTWALGPWLQVPWWVWSVAAAVTGVGLAVQLRAARRLPLVGERRRTWRVLSAIGYVAVLVVLAVVLFT